MKQGFILIFALIALFLLTGAQVLAGSISQQKLNNINQLWQGSAHAMADVNCSSCHQTEENQQLVVQPNHESCRSCHEKVVETFLLGKHGVRLGEGLSPLQPKMARLPMKEDASHKQMTCNTCHDVHSVNTVTAAVEACLSCHDDQHSRNYFKSKHGQMWQAQTELARPNQESVTCATCHLPRQTTESKEVFVNHNNTYTLLPRDRPVKEVCMNCHGMEYSYNSIFDDALVNDNFARPPTLNLKTLELIRALVKQRSGNATNDQ